VAQNGYVFDMIPGYGLRDRQFSSLVLDSSPGFKLSTAPTQAKKRKEKKRKELRGR